MGEERKGDYEATHRRGTKETKYDKSKRKERMSTKRGGKKEETREEQTYRKKERSNKVKKEGAGRRGQGSP